MKDFVISYKRCCNYRNQFSKPDQLVPVENLVELNLALGKLGCCCSIVTIKESSAGDKLFKFRPDFT